MDDDHRELARRLFAVATEILEDAIEIAVAGQSPRASATDLFDNAERLQSAARDIVAIAEAAMIVARLRVNHDPHRRKKPR